MPHKALLAVLAAVVTCLGALSMMIGPVLLSPIDIVSAVVGTGLEIDRVVVLEIRLPRTLLAATIGATLGLSGAAIQGLVRNPLASPSLLGTSQAAALGAVSALALGLGGALSYALPATAIVMSFVSALVLIMVTRNDYRPLSLILAGLALSSLFGALVSLALNLAPNPFSALEIAFWLLGSLADRSFDHLWLSLPFMAASWVLLWLQGRNLKALTLGEETARSLGVNLGRLRLLVVAGISIGVGAAVAVSGVIGFVGLVVPHLMRPLVAHDPARLAGPSALAGAALLLAADSAVKLIPTTGEEIRLGVLTALIGVPFFLYLVVRERSTPSG